MVSKKKGRTNETVFFSLSLSLSLDFVFSCGFGGRSYPLDNAAAAEHAS